MRKYSQLIIVFLLLNSSVAIASDEQWRFGNGSNGELSADIETEIGYQLKVGITVACNQGGPYIYTWNSSSYGQSEMVKNHLAKYDPDLWVIETYKEGMRTDRFAPNGFHGGRAKPENLTSLGDADLVILSGEGLPIAFTGKNSRIALKQLIAACNVIRD